LNIITKVKAKKERLKEIEKIVQTEAISSQEDILKLLISNGFEISKATLSRDIKKLKLIKIHDVDNRYLYVLPNKTEPKREKQHSIVGEDSTIEFSGNFAVIKTRPGYAMGIASDIDKHYVDEIVGTIAGDDTILVFPRDGYSKVQILSVLEKFLK
jgi:transcriptional regulator of arginine metabolism